RAKHGKRKTYRSRHLFIAPTRPNQLWAMDFVSDAFAQGRRFRILTLKDLFTHEAICLHVDRSITGRDVAIVLNRMIFLRGQNPEAIICDNGTEFTSKAMSIWEIESGVELRFIQPGKPTQNAFIESFNGRFRAECLDQNWFLNLEDARLTIEGWRREYNEDRPTKPLGMITPAEFAKRYEDLILKQN